MNCLLKSFPDTASRHLLRHAEKVELDRGMVLHEPYENPSFAYFPLTGVCSVVARTSSGHAVETSMLGNEACTGVAYLIGKAAVPLQIVQQVPGISLRVPFSDLRAAFRRSQEVRERILDLVQVWSLSMGQMVACQRLHHAEQRLARWLLMACQRANTRQFQLSHEFLAEMLGSGRPKVTLLLLEFKEMGFVDSERNGQISICDMAGLEATACECHAVITELYADLYQAPAALDIQTIS